MGEKCRYGRDSRVFYYDFEGNMYPYACPRDAEIDDFCIFHKEGYLEENKENEERVRKAFIEEFERKTEKKEEKLLFIGYRLPNIKLEGIIYGDLYFSQAAFRSADFSKSSLQRGIDLSNTKFEQGANFGGMAFPKKANFRDVTFCDAANFTKVKFMEPVYFDRATFRQQAEFFGTEMQQQAYFNETKFFGRAIFTYMKFKGRRAEFNQATFCDSVDFRDAMFENDVDFSEVTFEKGANFTNVNFKGAALFVETVFISREEENEEIEDVMDFKRVKFNLPEEVIFDNCALNRACFVHTDLTRLKFRNIKWPKPADWRSIGMLHKLSSIFGETDAYQLLDDILLEKKKRGIFPYIYKSDLTIENILTVYRMLRENYEYNVDYETSGRFFVGEMEARRRNTDSLADKITLWLYRTLSLYGQSYIRPFGLLLILIICFPFLVGLWNDLSLLFQGTSSSIVFGSIRQSFVSASKPESILQSFAVSLQLTGTEGAYIIQRILSIPLLLLFGLALRRRFERRFRH